MESKVLHMEEDEDAAEQEAEDKEEEEDPKEKPQGRDQQEKGIVNSSSSSSIPDEGNALGSQAPLQEGSGSASSWLGRADEVPAPVNPSSTKAWPYLELKCVDVTMTFCFPSKVRSDGVPESQMQLLSHVRSICCRAPKLQWPGTGSGSSAQLPAGAGGHRARCARKRMLVANESKGRSPSPA